MNKLNIFIIYGPKKSGKTSIFNYFNDEYSFLHSYSLELNIVNIILEYYSTIDRKYLTTHKYEKIPEFTPNKNDENSYGEGITGNNLIFNFKSYLDEPIHMDDSTNLFMEMCQYANIDKLINFINIVKKFKDSYNETENIIVEGIENAYELNRLLEKCTDDITNFTFIKVVPLFNGYNPKVDIYMNEYIDKANVVHYEHLNNRITSLCNDNNAIIYEILNNGNLSDLGNIVANMKLL